MWPVGPYAVPMTKYGCPETQTHGWRIGYINIAYVEPLGFLFEKYNMTVVSAKKTQQHYSTNKRSVLNRLHSSSPRTLEQYSSKSQSKEEETTEMQAPPSEDHLLSKPYDMTTKTHSMGTSFTQKTQQMSNTTTSISPGLGHRYIEQHQQGVTNNYYSNRGGSNHQQQQQRSYPNQHHQQQQHQRNENGFYNNSPRFDNAREQRRMYHSDNRM